MNEAELSSLSVAGEMCSKKEDIKLAYQKAHKIIEGYNSKSLVRNDAIFPHWISDSHCFWYDRSYLENTGDKDGVVCKQYRIVDAEAATNDLAFDHAGLARALSNASGQEVKADNLPFDFFTMSLSSGCIAFQAFDKHWVYSVSQACCNQIDDVDVPVSEALSPDGRYLVFVKDSNIWIRKLLDNTHRALTTDGCSDYAYGMGDTSQGVKQVLMKPALWSPDSKKILVTQRDTRNVKSLAEISHVPSDGNIKPKVRQSNVAYAGDKVVETVRLLAIDVSDKRAIDACIPAMPACISQQAGFFEHVAWWLNDSRHVCFIDQERGDKTLRLMKFDTEIGTTELIFEEKSSSYVSITPEYLSLPLHRYLSQTNELIWWSERSGWGHLYLYDLSTGRLKKTVTQGGWLVRDVLYVDQARREIYVHTIGRDLSKEPYYRDVCRINIDSGELIPIISKDMDCVVHSQDSFSIFANSLSGLANPQSGGVSPDGQFIVVTQSRVDTVPETWLVDKDGQEILRIERADVSSLPDSWQPPESIEVLSADGKDVLYGTLNKPSDFSPEKKYPVINYITGAPWLSAVPKSSFHSAQSYSDRHYFYAAALAELGFIVLILDGQGTPLRGKKFNDKSYGWIPSAANSDDHCSALKQLSERNQWMDLKQVGIYCQGYRSGLQNFLERQDIYDVCVQMNLLDDRLSGTTAWHDRYEGVEDGAKARQYPEHLVTSMKGRLLLMNVLDNIYSTAIAPAGTFRVIDALQKANKNFDMLVLPYIHNSMANNYMQRRAWDYLVKNLRQINPPKEYELGEVSMGRLANPGAKS